MSNYCEAHGHYVAGCQECRWASREYNRARSARLGKTPEPRSYGEQLVVDTQLLSRMLERDGRSRRQLCEDAGVSERLWYRIMERGTVREGAADMLAGAFGVHLSELAEWSA